MNEMNSTDREHLVERLVSLLRETEAAHIEYESSVLAGVRDEEWPRWYADYMLAAGAADLLPGRQAASLRALLAEADATHRANAPDEDWHTYYAQFLAGKAVRDAPRSG